MTKIKKDLVDTSRRQKAVQAIKGKLKNLRTIVIISGESPGYTPLPEREEVGNIKQELEAAGFRTFPTKGKYFGVTEQSYMVYNMSLQVAKHYASKFGQESFIFITIDENNDTDESKMSYNYYETDGTRLGTDPNTYNYQLSKTENRFDVIEGDENYTAISRGFKFTIPFNFLDSLNEQIDRQRAYIGTSYNRTLKRHLDSVTADTDTGMAAYYRRKKIYGGK